jgi:hypothetical protein
LRSAGMKCQGVSIYVLSLKKCNFFNVVAVEES